MAKKYSKTKLKFFTWHDTGNIFSYEKVREVYHNEIVAPKKEETIFLENQKVIKYFFNNIYTNKFIKINIML